MKAEEIIALLPYQKPFLFVDEICEVSDSGITGNYTFHKEDYFYKGHFKDYPVTPGVIITELMAQIGVVCLGIFISKPTQSVSEYKIALTSHKVDFFVPVFPGEKITVVSEKQYFRFNKLKCSVKAFNDKDELIARGEIAGMLSK